MLPNCLPNLITYGVINVVIIATTPTKGNRKDVTIPESYPVFITTKDSSPLAIDIPNPVLNAVILLYFALIKIPVTINNLDTKDVITSINAGTIQRIL